MGIEEIGSERKTGNVKAAVGLFGERFSEGNASLTLNKAQIDFSEKQTPRTREVHMPGEESELSNAKKIVRDITSKIEESSSKAKFYKQQCEQLKSRKQDHEQIPVVAKHTVNYIHYAEVMRDLEKVKQDLGKLKLEMGSIIEEKNRAEKEAKDNNLKVYTYMKSVDALELDIDEVNDEQVLFELAQIEASKELSEFEAQRDTEAQIFSSKIEDTKKKMEEFLEEIDRVKELEVKLALTNKDIEIMENQIKMAKEMSLRDLELVKKELELAKNELTSIREEGFQLMASMDVIRNELICVSEKAAFLKKKEEKADQKVHNLNSKLLRAKEELEAVSSSEEKAKAIVDNLLLSCEHVKTELEASKKVKELICENTTNLKAQIERHEVEKESAEMNLEAAIQELEAVKSSELEALEKLKSLAEKTMIDRAFASKHSSKITISKFEYEYLKSRAVEAREIADKKVSAAHAWIEASEANEKEIRMKIEIAQSKIRKEEKSFLNERLIPGEIVEERDWDESSEIGGELRRKSIKKSGGLTPGRRLKLRIPASPKLRYASGSFSVNKRREKIMPNLGKLFGSKGI